MANNSDGNNGGPSDPRLSATPLNSLHINYPADLIRLADQLPVNWSLLPQLPFFGPLLGIRSDYYRSAVALAVLESRWLGQRSLTTDEVQVIATQAAKSVVTLAYEAPCLAGTVWLYESRGRAAFRFPFYQPDPAAGFDPNVFPTKKTPILRGINARFQWHMTRALAYSVVAHAVLGVLFRSYALSVKGIEFQNDPRLANLHQSISKAQAERRAEQRRQGGGPLPLPPMPPLSDEELSKDPSESTTVGAETFSSSSSSSSYDDSTGQEASSSSSPVQQGSFRSYRTAPTASSSSSSSGAASQSAAGTASTSYDGSDYDIDGFDDEGYHDDASPVAPTARGKGWQTQSAGGGSAWDRVRSQATGEPGHQQQQQNLGGPRIWPHGQRRYQPPAKTQPAAESQQTDSDYSYGAADEEKSYAREDAQKAFDAMLEKERRGESDDVGRRRR